MSKDSKNFKDFCELSFSDILSQLNSTKKINPFFYYKALNLENTQELLEIKNPTKDTLTTFVYSQVEFNTRYFINRMGIEEFRTIINHNKIQAEKTARQCTIKQKEVGGEMSIITELTYVLLFRYFKEFNTKCFIPILVDYETPGYLTELTTKALTYSRLYYHMYGKYLPIVYCISLSRKCPHAISYICLPSEDNQNPHQFNGVVIDTASIVTSESESETEETCVNEFTDIMSYINDGFNVFSNLPEDSITLKQVEDKCSVNLQDRYSICANYSLGIVLNYLFQQDQLASKVLDVCDTLNKKGTAILKNILVTIGNVSKLFNQFLRHTVFEPIENNSFIEAYNSYFNSRLIDNKLNKEHYIKKLNNANEKFEIIPELIVMFLKNPIDDKKTLWVISKFLKDCNKVIREWDLDNLERNVYNDKQEEQRLLEKITNNMDEYNKIEIKKKKKKTKGLVK